jgi:hypothetical protein
MACPVRFLAILLAAVLAPCLALASCASLPRHVVKADCFVATAMEAGEGEEAAFAIEARSCGQVEWTVLQALALREAARTALGLGWESFTVLASISSGWAEEGTEWRVERLRIGGPEAGVEAWRGPYTVEGLAAWLSERATSLSKSSFSVALLYAEAVLAATKAVEPTNLEVVGP